MLAVPQMPGGGGVLHDPQNIYATGVTCFLREGKFDAAIACWRQVSDYVEMVTSTQSLIEYAIRHGLEEKVRELRKLFVMKEYRNTGYPQDEHSQSWVNERWRLAWILAYLSVLGDGYAADVPIEVAYAILHGEADELFIEIPKYSDIHSVDPLLRKLVAIRVRERIEQLNLQARVPELFTRSWGEVDADASIYALSQIDLKRVLELLLWFAASGSTLETDGLPPIPYAAYSESPLQ